MTAADIPELDVPFTYEMRISAIKLCWWSVLGVISWVLVWALVRALMWLLM